MKRFVTSLASLRLTILLLVLGMALVLGGTFAQRTMGTFVAVDIYFASWLVFLPIPGFTRPVPLFPGGYLLGSLLVANLLAALWVFRQRALRDPAHLLTHVGLVLLVAGVLANSLWTVESYMSIDEGATAGYSQDYRRTELIIVRQLDDGQDQVTSIPEERFQSKTVSAPEIPFQVRVIGIHRDTILVQRLDASGQVQYMAEHAPQEMLKESQSCLTVQVELFRDGTSLGRYWFTSSAVWDGMSLRPQGLTPIAAEGQVWYLGLRLRRYYSGQSVTLLDFQNQRYAGSDISAEFSSRVHVVDASSGETRDALISMNQPLRFRGYTYYQSGFRNDDRTTVLQVVRNPIWLVPYISCTLIALGMTIAFWRALHRHMARRHTESAAQGASRSWRRPAGLAALGVAALAVLLCLNALRPPAPATPVDTTAFGRLPVLANGRLKPMDSVARNTLLQLHGSQTLRFGDESLSASAWLLTVVANPFEADHLAVFQIDSPDVLGLMQRVPDDGRYYSFVDLLPHMTAIAEAAQRAREAANMGKPASAFDAAVMNLDERILLYSQLKNSLQPGIDVHYAAAIVAAHQAGDPAWAPDIAASAQFIASASAFAPIPIVRDGVTTWVSMGQAVVDSHPADLSPMVLGYAELIQHVRANESTGANAALSRLTELARPIAKNSRVRAEFQYNHSAPFYLAMCIYLLVFLCMLVAWLRWWEFGSKAAFSLLLVAVTLHTLGLVWRVWLHGYAPITNLYSSAVFVGWIAALLSLFVEWRHRHGIGSVGGATVGFLTLIVAQHLARSGETMEMMRAVLASNFWLSTHVVTIAMGYSGMFLAGTIGVVAVLHDAVSRQRPGWSTRLAPTVWGILCFATLFSFIGTVLGGIWADQSWGRFWGWDPKENGALLIVAWCAIVLHARLGRLLDDHGLQLAIVAGNIVTAFSWFGVNLLGVGLHSYGFTTNGLFWLLAFMASQLVVLAIGAAGPRADRLAYATASPRRPHATPSPSITAP